MQTSPKITNPAPIPVEHRRMAGAVVAMWLLVSLLTTLHVWSNAPGDLLSLSFALLLSAPGFASLIYWSAYRQRQERTYLMRFLAVQLAAVLLVAGLAAANSLALRREARFAAWEELPTYNYAMRDRELYNFVPGEGGLLAPDLDLEMQGYILGETIQFRTNNYGFRNTSDTKIPKPKGIFRILNLGDSFVAGYAMNDDETLGYFLERELDKLAGKTGKIEVLNAHIQSPAGARLFLEREAHRYEPDMIIINVCTVNDFGNDYWMLGKRPDQPPKPIYHLSEEDTLTPLPRDEWKANVREMLYFNYSPELDYPEDAFFDPPAERLPYYKASAKREEERQSRHFALGRFLAELAARSVASGEYQGQAQFPLPGDRVFDWYGTTAYLKGPQPQVDASEHAMAAAFDGIEAWCAARDIPVVLTVLPPRWLVVEQDFKATFEAGVVKPDAYDFARPHRFLVAEAAERDWELRDLTEDFQALGSETWRYFLPRSDCHFSARGYELVGKKIAETAAQLIPK